MKRVRFFWLWTSLGMILSACGADRPAMPSFDERDGDAISAPVAQHAAAEVVDSTVVMPHLRLTAKSVPEKESELDKLLLTIEADPAFTHYGYKISTSKECGPQAGYVMNEVAVPLEIDQTLLPFGSVYLCLLGYHGALKRWQPASEAQVHVWQKVPFRRSIKSYFEFNATPQQCDEPTIIRFLTTLNIEGDKGTYSFSVTAPPNCPGIVTTTGVKQIVSVRNTATESKGTFLDSDLVGWFNLKFTNPERTAFQGSWGFGDFGVAPVGPWNSLP